MGQWLRLQVPDAGGPSSIPGQGTRSHIPPELRLRAAKQIHINKILKKKKKEAIGVKSLGSMKAIASFGFGRRQHCVMRIGWPILKAIFPNDC